MFLYTSKVLNQSYKFSVVNQEQKYTSYVAIS